ncbi:N-6 DNA methylase [Psychrilyobacter sp.]|uniref:N-6 DNA methylase n=1 Tax=Psychrilyobacter sp. TaxID=2586924 RepID=UPI00301A6D03
MFENENPSLNRFKFYNYKDLLKKEKFKELYKILSYENNYNQEYLLENFNSPTTKSELFTDHFLNNIRKFRKEIAQNIMDNNSFDIESISYLTERLIDKIVFSKVSFDRELQGFKSFNTIKTFKDFNIFIEKVYKICPIEILKADKKTIINDKIIEDLLNKLTYENSPYDFSVVEASVLGEIYEQYLCEKLEIKNKKINVVLKEEVKSNGIVYTPSNIANKIIELTLRDDFILNKEQKVLDICCGSGTFLIEVYKWICDEYLDYYYSNNNNHNIEMTKEKKLKLTFEEKIKIFKLHIFGVDISHDSLEVTKLNIYLKMLELEEKIPTKTLKGV